MSNKLDQKGAVSILSVVIFTTIITVLITAYLRNAVSQQAEALNYDLSNRAFYAAEAGVQDTVRYLVANNTVLDSSTKKEDCKPYSASPTTGIGVLSQDLNLEYICQRFTVKQQSLSGTVRVNKQSAIMKLDPTTVINPASPKLVIRWSEEFKEGSLEQPLGPRGYGVPYLTPLDGWNQGGLDEEPIHAMLRVSVIDTPKSGITTANTTQRVSFFNPTTSTNNTDGDVDFRASNNTLDTQQKQLFNNATCYPSETVPVDAGMSDGETTYSCKQTVDLAGYDFSNKDIYVRVSSIYRDTRFSVQLLNNSTVVSLTNAQVSIDITSRAGGTVYRRVVQRVPLDNYRVIDTTEDGATGSEAALVAGEGICKQFTIGTNAGAYNRGCDPFAL